MKHAKKMNQQIHILSAEFISFNAKLNNFIETSKQTTKIKINADEVIDKDAKVFFTENSMKIQNVNSIESTVSFQRNKKVIA